MMGLPAVTEGALREPVLRRGERRASDLSRGTKHGGGGVKRPTCATCAYFNEPADEFEPGQCCRRAPLPLVIPLPGPGVCASAAESLAIWPNVEDGNWCGEHSDFAEYLASQAAARQAFRAPVPGVE